MLALVGSGEYLSEVDAIDLALIGRLSAPPRVVCLPTAAGREGDTMIHSWMERGVRHFERLGAEVQALKVWDRETAHNIDFANTIRAANFVYMSGGSPNYLAQCFEGSPVWEAVLSVHERGDVVAGCSAGAMIMGTRIAGPGGNRDGFDLISDSLIMPHFDEYPSMVSRVMRLFSGNSLRMIGIDGRTALLVEEGQYSVAGRGNVTIFSKSGKQAYPSGALPTDAL